MSTMKKCQVVLLRAKEKAENLLVLYNDRLMTPSKEFLTQSYLEYVQAKAFHLYILLDEEAKDDDWIYYKNGDLEGIYHMKNGAIPKTMVRKKIIATTDSSLILPISDKFKGTKFPYPVPTQEFLKLYSKEYSKGNMIKEVMVEFEEVTDIPVGTYTVRLTKSPHNNESNADMSMYISILKINPKDNTITIKPIKESWAREELSIFKNSEGNNHLKFIYERMKHVHNENENYDYMLKLKSIVDFIESELC